MKYGIDCGHNCPPDIGASGIRQEDVMTKDVGARVTQKLKAMGHQVVSCNPSRASSVGNSLAQRCHIANSNNVDVFVSIHFNCFNGKAKGAEVLALGNTSTKLAKSVLDNIISLGYFNRGVKDGSHIYVLKYTDMPAILVECCFCDAKEDMDRYNPEALADAIVKGLTGKEPAKPTPTPDTKQDSTEKPITPPQPDNSLLKMQQALNRLKITDSNGKAVVEDGTADPATTSAIKKFQSIVGIGQTGIAGNDTWGAMNQILAKPVLRENHPTGPAVRYLQHRLGMEIDGIYGPNTANVVKKFQSQNGLTADGILGPQSWTKLIS
ncbi:MAG TPA: cell wall hydrolase [Cyanobacteria bacterium UBA8803]|nr:cell wall hydrolase [Cyanobacteria bacterium UBA9273]HBL60018.1 cell wall hydrolase [Cyanobacteria bacterium UBA8803]